MKKYIYLLIGFILILTIPILYFIVFPHECGYESTDNTIPCECLGLKRKVTNSKGPMNLNSQTVYCYGISQTRVCHDEITEKQIDNPYPCDKAK